MTVRIGGSNSEVNQLSEGQKNAIINGVFAMANSISNGGQAPVTQGKASYETRQASYQKMIRKEAELTMALQTQAGLKKIAANMANPKPNGIVKSDYMLETPCIPHYLN